LRENIEATTAFDIVHKCPILVEPDFLLPTDIMSLLAEVRLNKTSNEFYFRLYMYH